MMKGLAARLRRLDRSRPPAGSALRERLERMDRAASSSRRAPIDRFVVGDRVDTPAGPVFRVVRTAPASKAHGRLPVGELGRLPCEGLRDLFPRELGRVGAPPEIAFLDTETTGLAGGAGTVAFLVGVGRWDPGGRGFRVVQLFLEDLDREPALLHALARELEGVSCLVTFNGHRFDVPLLENRHVLNRMAWPLEGAPHLDLLPPARALWRPTLSNCRLVTLEAGVLAVRRTGDVPGAEIPALYGRYLRHGAEERLGRVFSHNRIDILSLAGLLWAAGRAARRPVGPQALGVGLLHAQARRPDRAHRALAAGLDHAPSRGDRIRALRELGRAHKARGDWHAALAVWQEWAGLEPHRLEPVEEAAKALEHRLRDPGRALAWVERALGLPHWPPADRAALEHRRDRLRRKAGDRGV